MALYRKLARTSTLRRQQQASEVFVNWPVLVKEGDHLFLQACQDPSNLETDWLWLNNSVQRKEQKIYCLQMARFINPGSEFAGKELRKLRR